MGRGPDGAPPDGVTPPAGHGPGDRAVPPGAVPGPLRVARRAFTGIGLVTLFGNLIIIVVATRPAVPPWLRALTILVMVATGLLWYRGAIRGHYGGVDGVVDASAVFLVAFTADSIPLTAGTGLMMARAVLGAMSGSLPAKLAHAAVGFGCLTAGLSLAADPAPNVVDGLILSGIWLFGATLLFHYMSGRLRRGEHALERERMLAHVSDRLNGPLDERRVSEIVLDAVVDLAGGPVRAAVAVGMAERLEVTAATGDLPRAVGAILRLDGDRPWPPRREPAAPALPLLDQLRATGLTLPMTAQGTVYGALLVDLAGPARADLRGWLEWLCSLAGPALAAARLTAELAERAFFDPLTRLPNRALLHEHTAEALARAEREGTTVGLLVLDLDGFKKVNDRFGHRAGDEALAIAAARLRDEIRDADVAARLGGDEFAVLLPSVRDTAEAAAIARRIIGTLGRPLPIEGTAVPVGVSVGIARWSGAASPAAGEGAARPSPDALLHAADVAMYRAKTRGTGYHLAGAG